MGVGKLVLADNAGTGAGTDYAWPGGRTFFSVEATWTGGSVKLQTLGPNGSWIDFPDGEITANGGVMLHLPSSRFRISSTTATAVYATLLG